MEELISQDPSSSQVIHQFVTGSDLVRDPAMISNRWIIDFKDWPEQQARSYHACFRRVELTVKPERLSNKIESRRTYWWQYIGRQVKLYSSIVHFKEVIVTPQVSKYRIFLLVPSNQVFADKVVVIASNDPRLLVVLNSSLHDQWAGKYGGFTAAQTPNYNLASCYETFPFPSLDRVNERQWEELAQARGDAALACGSGLTDIYNKVHEQSETQSWIEDLRATHIETDYVTATAYDWSDLDLCHGFHETKQGVRFTISESARREVLARLRKLNHERYADEEKQGKVKPASSGRGRKSKASAGTPTFMFGDDDKDDPDPSDEPEDASTPTRGGISPKPNRADRRVQPTLTPELPARPTPIDQIETDEIMAAFRQAARGKGWLDRDELLKEVSLVLGYQRLGPKIDEALRGHLRAAIRRRIIETDGPNLVRSGAVSMAEYDPDELVEVFRSVMRKGTTYDREEVVPALARHLGFIRLTDTIREPIRKAITRAICHGLLGYEGSTIWRET